MTSGGPILARMRLNAAIFCATALVVLAVQLLLDLTIFQITFSFAHEGLFWQAVSALLLASIVTASFALLKKTSTAAH